MDTKVLEICPYEPPASGWVTRVKLIRQVIEERGGVCEILDIGPSRRTVRPGCVPVMGAWDYVSKVSRFARQRHAVHCHINGEYFRGLLLALTALALARLSAARTLVTFHGGTHQAFLAGWSRRATAPFYWLIFRLAQVVICNSEAVKAMLVRYAPPARVEVVPAFSSQYLQHRTESLSTDLERFLEQRSPVVTTYLSFRDGFFIEDVLEALSLLVRLRPNLGAVIVGTGEAAEAFERALEARGLRPYVFLAGSLTHGAFLTLLARSTIHLRTPVTDGVSATVMEALSLRVPVVASENGGRPPGVRTYPARNPDALAEALEWAFKHRDTLTAGLPAVHVEDTAVREVDLILGTPPRHAAGLSADPTLSA